MDPPPLAGTLQDLSMDIISYYSRAVNALFGALYVGIRAPADYELLKQTGNRYHAEQTCTRLLVSQAIQ